MTWTTCCRACFSQISLLFLWYLSVVNRLQQNPKAVIHMRFYVVLQITSGMHIWQLQPDEVNFGNLEARWSLER